MDTLDANFLDAKTAYTELYGLSDLEGFTEKIVCFHRFEDKFHFVKWYSIWLGDVDDDEDLLDDYSTESDAVDFYFGEGGFKFSKNGYVFSDN